MNRLLLVAVVGILVATIALVAIMIANPQWVLDVTFRALVYGVPSLASEVAPHLPWLAAAAVAIVGWRARRWRVRTSTGDR